MTVNGTIYVKNDLTISGGTVTATDSYSGIDASVITISGGTVNATGDFSGILASSITISGGTVNATGGRTGIFVSNNINISGGTVEATGGEYGIQANGDITIESGGTVKEASGDNGIYSDWGGITISGTVTKASGTNGSGIYAGGGSITISGTVTASGSQYGIQANRGITISGGTVTATGGQYGIHAGDGIIIEYGSTVTAKGETQAVSGSVKNAAPGIGWEDAAGTEGKALIELPSDPESGQSLTSYKQVRFPVPYDITPEPEPECPGIDFFRLHGDCELPATGFSALRPTVLPEQPKDLRYEPVRMHLMLPTLDRDVELVTMPREGNSWAAAWLGSDAGILEGSALPGEGVSVIAGHNTLNDTDFGPFALLATLEVNDTVMVREESGALKLFRVYANELLEPDDIERLSALAGDDALVLLTCENESPAGGYLNRRAVFAR